MRLRRKTQFPSEIEVLRMLAEEESLTNRMAAKLEIDDYGEGWAGAYLRDCLNQMADEILVDVTKRHYERALSAAGKPEDV